MPLLDRTTPTQYAKDRMSTFTQNPNGNQKNLLCRFPYGKSTHVNIYIRASSPRQPDRSILRNYESDNPLHRRSSSTLLTKSLEGTVMLSWTPQQTVQPMSFP